MTNKTVSYLNIAKNIEEVQENPETSIEKLQKKGWIVLNKKSIKNEMAKLQENKKLKEESEFKNLLVKNWDNYCNESAIRWNNYRDQDIELYGDRSIYYNYKSELESMVKEEQYIREEIHKISTGFYNDNDSDRDKISYFFI